MMFICPIRAGKGALKMNEKLIEQIQEKMNSKSTEELLNIWKENNREEYSNEAFVAIQRILTERGESLPAQLKDESAVTKKQTIAICFPNNEIKVYENNDNLREEIIRGDVRMDYKARLIGISAEGSDESKEIEWSTLEKISDTDFKLQTLYRPVWAYTMKGLTYGAIVGIALKALDTTWLFFQIDQTTGFVWLMIVGSLFVTKWWWWAPGVPLFLSFKLGIKANLFITFLAVMFVGAIFGGPAGMVVGTIVGHFRARNIPKAPDADPEGAKPYLIGLLVPLMFLVVAIPSYLFWLMPKIIDWLS